MLAARAELSNISPGRRKEASPLHRAVRISLKFSPRPLCRTMRGPSGSFNAPIPTTNEERQHLVCTAPRQHLVVVRKPV